MRLTIKGNQESYQTGEIKGLKLPGPLNVKMYLASHNHFVKSMCTLQVSEKINLRVEVQLPPLNLPGSSDVYTTLHTQIR